MIDKKIINTIDTLIEKIKDNNLNYIKLSNKTVTIEISNNSIIQGIDQNIQDISSLSNHNLKNFYDSRAQILHRQLMR